MSQSRTFLGTMHPTYDNLLGAIYASGFPVRVRGLETYEAINGHVSIKMGYTPKRVKMNPQLGIVEGLMAIAGIHNVSYIKKAAPSVDLSLFGENTAYGPRTKSQMHAASKLLRTSPDSRRAQVIIAKPKDVRDEPGPCTTSIQFIVRRGHLDAVVTMRSWDIAWGLPYDLLMFGIIGSAMAYSVGVLPGVLHVNAGSIHVYDETAHLVKLDDSQYYYARLAPNMPEPGKPWSHYEKWARQGLEKWYNEEKMDVTFKKDELIDLDNYVYLSHVR